jgi:AcrR family transcriptional regulator
VLEVARELFATSGLDVTMRQIARHAQIGPATLYRRFPTKQALILEAMKDEFRACRAIVRDAAGDPDAWRGFCSVIERITVLNAQNQGFTDAFLSAYPGAIDFDSHRTQILHEISRITERAQADGDLRSDFVLDDFILVLLAGRGLTSASAPVRVVAARRFAALAIEGLRARDANSTLPEPARLLPTVVGTAH